MTDFSKTRAAFHVPDGVIYLDGNSLGPLPRAAADRVAACMTRDWGQGLIRSWNTAGWMAQPDRLGDRIGRLIGAAPGSVTVGDTLSIKVFQALAAALHMRPDRSVILSDSGNFPSDLYMAEGLSRLMEGKRLKIVPPQEVAAHLGDDVAVLMLTEVDYRTGRRHDLPGLTRAAQAAGAVVIWDLAHSAGALEVDMAASGAEFACGCTYKYLNGGPGAPAFIYMRPDLADRVQPVLAGWMGHAAPFTFDLGYRPGPGTSRMRIGTPPVLQMAALEAALDIWDGVDMADVRAASIALSERFVREVETRCGAAVTLASPRDPQQRGSQVSFRHPQGYAVMQALIARGVIGDFRAPDLMRFGFAPLYNTEAEVIRAAEVLGEILATAAWDRPEFHQRAAVT